MSFESIVTQQLTEITNVINGINNNAKKTEDLPIQNTLIGGSKIRISTNGVSESLELQKILDIIPSDLQNKINKLGRISLVTNTITIEASSEWIINNIIHVISSNTDIVIPYTTPTYTRIDIIVANELGQFELIQGIETTGIATPPFIPQNTLLVIEVIVSENTISTRNQTIVGNIYISKKEKLITRNSVLSGTDQFITLESDESGFYSFTNAGLQSIAGIIESSTIYAGKEITIQNYTVNDLIIIHDHSSHIPFYTIFGGDIILRSGELVVFKISNELNVALELFRSHTDTQIYKTISANTVVNDSYHNSIVFVTSNCTITLPPYLRGDLVFNVRTFAGVTVTYVSGVNATINAESNGNTQAEKSMANICTYSSNNFLISGGKLSW